ncbi:MAG: hypothetical protein AAFY60_11660, partial [Myxococcota bacterium]
PTSPTTGPTPVGRVCTPSALLELDGIPDNPGLNDGDPDTVAIFEVNGHRLIGKHVTDRDAALGGLKLWQEITTRIPENQLLDLVQLDIYEDTDPVAIFNRTGRVTTDRPGVKLGFSTLNFSRNDPDPCAPLVPRRGSFDWSLVHEFGHLRGWMDGSWDRFLVTFPDERGDGAGYPEDGSPVLTGDFVTSYAERADGDEDHAESWTTYVMLESLPPERADEPLALKKVRWMESQPGLSELRAALRISEPDGGGVTIAPAPRRVPGGDTAGGSLDSLTPPASLRGNWASAPGVTGESGVSYRFEISASDVVEIRLDAGGNELGRRSIASLADSISNPRFSATSNSLTYQLVISNDEVLEDTYTLDRINGVPYLYWSRLDVRNDIVLGSVPGHDGGEGGPLDAIRVPEWLHGDWSAEAGGVSYRLRITDDDLEVSAIDENGATLPVSLASEMRARAERFTVTEEGLEFAINAALPDEDIPQEDAFYNGSGGILWGRLSFENAVALTPFE